jgi:hypothetical protein
MNSVTAVRFRTDVVMMGVVYVSIRPLRRSASACAGDSADDADVNDDDADGTGAADDAAILVGVAAAYSVRPPSRAKLGLGWEVTAAD